MAGDDGGERVVGWTMRMMCECFGVTVTHTQHDALNVTCHMSHNTTSIWGLQIPMTLEAVTYKRRPVTGTLF
jgi:hypothetical protein